jgi:hypothetical protein
MEDEAGIAFIPLFYHPDAHAHIVAAGGHSCIRVLLMGKD